MRPRSLLYTILKLQYFCLYITQICSVESYPEDHWFLSKLRNKKQKTTKINKERKRKKKKIKTQYFSTCTFGVFIFEDIYLRQTISFGSTFILETMPIIHVHWMCSHPAAALFTCSVDHSLLVLTLAR